MSQTQRRWADKVRVFVNGGRIAVTASTLSTLSHMQPDNARALPPELQAHLDAAGVVDDASLEAAPNNDPQLKADLLAHVQNDSAMQLQALARAFVDVVTPEALQVLYRNVPSELEAPLIAFIEAQIAEAQGKADEAVLANATAKLNDFKQLCKAAAAQQLPPVAQALMDFVRAPDEAAARVIYQQHKALMAGYEAQQVLDQQFESDKPEDQQRISTRSALLRQLRGAAPLTARPIAGETADAYIRPMQHSNPPGIAGNMYQAGGDINIQQVSNLERRFVKPVVPGMGREMTARPDEVAAVRSLLNTRSLVAIGGMQSAVAVQGMPGVGKSVLARLVAAAAQDEFTDGVLWTDIGPEITQPDQT